jgi:hypothetical protein
MRTAWHADSANTTLYKSTRAFIFNWMSSWVHYCYTSNRNVLSFHFVVAVRSSLQIRLSSWSAATNRRKCDLRLKLVCTWLLSVKKRRQIVVSIIQIRLLLLTLQKCVTSVWVLIHLIQLSFFYHFFNSNITYILKFPTSN